MKLLHLHTLDGKEVIINADNIEMYGIDSETSKTWILTNYLKGKHIIVNEPMHVIDSMFNLE